MLTAFVDTWSLHSKSFTTTTFPIRFLPTVPANQLNKTHINSLAKAPCQLQTLKIGQPVPAQHALQLIPHLHRTIEAALCRNLGPLRGTELAPAGQDRTVDYRAARGSRFYTYGPVALGHAVRLCVETAVRHQRREELVGDGQEATVRRLAERAKRGEGARRRG